MKKTKIVSTLGPSSFHVSVIANLIKAGVNVFRFNFSHGDHKQHLHTYHMVQQAEKQTGKIVGIDCDTKGAEIRTTANQGGKNFAYHKGDKFSIAMDASGKKISTKGMIQSTYTGLFNDVKVGDHVLFDDGILDTICEKKDNSKHCLDVTVQNDATLGSRKTIDIPNSIVHLPGVTKKDADDITFACEHMNINYITASFLRSPKDVKDIRKILKKTHMEDVQIFPKLENQQGIDNLKGIMKLADGVMVPRGDMAVNIPFQNVPLVQRHMIHYCNKINKPVIVATQMEASMAQNPRPSRAEVEDCATAVWEGADATMLSGETAAGNWPVHAVKAMSKNDMKAENSYEKYGDARPVNKHMTEGYEAMVHCTTEWAKDLDLHVIVTDAFIDRPSKFSRMNVEQELRHWSQYHPNAIVLVLTNDRRLAGNISIYWGIHPMIVKKPKKDYEKLAEDCVLASGAGKPGDVYLIGHYETYNYPLSCSCCKVLEDDSAIDHKNIIVK